MNTNTQGVVVERSAYKPFGQRLEITSSGQSITNRGYTGHEEIEGTNFIHMNARLYDSSLGRFISADTIVQDPHDMQTYNRYAYVRNNPLKYTDPSGHSFSSIIQSLVKLVVTVALISTGAGAFVIGFVNGFLSATLAGGDISQAFTAGFTSGLFSTATAAFATGVAEYFRIEHSLPHEVTIWDMKEVGLQMARAAAHGVVNGVLSMAQGGKFGSGFASAFVSSLFAPGKGDGSGHGIETRTAIAAIIGGTASELTGGKFANGAVSAAVLHMYNNEQFGRLFNFTPGDDLYRILGADNPQDAERNGEMLAEESWKALKTTGSYVTIAGGAGSVTLVRKTLWWLGGFTIDASNTIEDDWNLWNTAPSWATPLGGKVGTLWSVGITIHNPFLDDQWYQDGNWYKDNDDQ